MGISLINTIIQLLTGQDLKKEKYTERNLERYLNGVSFTNTRCGTSDNYTHRSEGRHVRGLHFTFITIPVIRLVQMSVLPAHCP